MCAVDKGQMLCFQGNLLHGADAVLQGTRYIIAAFLVVLPEASDNDQQEVSDISEHSPASKRIKLDYQSTRDSVDASSSFVFNFSCAEEL